MFIRMCVCGVWCVGVGMCGWVCCLNRKHMGLSSGAGREKEFVQRALFKDYGADKEWEQQAADPQNMKSPRERAGQAADPTASVSLIQGGPKRDDTDRSRSQVLVLGLAWSRPIRQPLSVTPPSPAPERGGE